MKDTKRILFIIVMTLFLISMIKYTDQKQEYETYDSITAYEKLCLDYCERYKYTDDAEDAMWYCEKYFPIDLNSDGKVVRENAKINNFSVCEDRVYCLNLATCNGPNNTTLTPEICKSLMCYTYTRKFEGNETAAEEHIENIMQFGSCDEAQNNTNGVSWWKNNFEHVKCDIDQDYIKNEQIKGIDIIQSTKLIKKLE